MVITKNKLEDIIEVTDALCEIALKCDSCAVQAREVIQKYCNNNCKTNHQVGGPLSDLANQTIRRNEGVSNVQEYSTNKYK